MIIAYDWSILNKIEIGMMMILLILESSKLWLGEKEKNLFLYRSIQKEMMIMLGYQM